MGKGEREEEEDKEHKLWYNVHSQGFRLFLLSRNKKGDNEGTRG